MDNQDYLSVLKKVLEELKRDFKKVDITPEFYYKKLAAILTEIKEIEGKIASGDVQPDSEGKVIIRTGDIIGSSVNIAGRDIVITKEDRNELELTKRELSKILDINKGKKQSKDRPIPGLKTKVQVWVKVVMVMSVLILIVVAILSIRPPVSNPPSDTETIILGSSDWQFQHHPDCQAVYNVNPLRDGQTLEILSDFNPDKIELKTGEAIVYLTQGAIKPDDMTTFHLEEMRMEIEVPKEINVSFFLKDLSWQNVYWSLSTKDSAQAQKVFLDAKLIKPTFISSHFDSNRAIALGLQFYTNTYRGPARILVRNVQLLIRPTNLILPVTRLPINQFIQHCGVDLPVIYGDHDFGRPNEGGPHQGLSVHVEELRSCLDFLASKEVKLVRIALFRDFNSGLRIDNLGQIIGLDESVYSDMDVLLAEASQHSGMRLLLTLFDGPLVKRWPNMIINSQERQLLCEQILHPFLSRYALSNVIYGIEVISDPEGIAEVYGDETTKEFVNEVLMVIQRIRPRLKTAIGHRSRAGLDRFNFSGFDIYTFYYDPTNQRHDPFKIRRELMPFPLSPAEVIIVARLPLVSYSDERRQRPPFTSYAIQDAFDYGYSGIIFSSLEMRENRLSFRGREGDAFASWISQQTE